MDYHELRSMSLPKLREVARTSGLDGGSQMHKEQLLKALCALLHIEMHEHHEVVGVDKASLKQELRALKRQRDAALASHDRAALARVRHQIHRAKGRLRRATV
jgi:hypothetical protein